MTHCTPARARELANEYCPNEGLAVALRSLADQLDEALSPPKNIEAVAAPIATEPVALERAHELGFLRCAGWAQRDDLLSDVTSPAYRKDRAHDLATIATPPQAASPAARLRGYRDGLTAAQPVEVQRVPLTGAEIDAAFDSVNPDWWDVPCDSTEEFARAIEAAHGIKPTGGKGAP